MEETTYEILILNITGNVLRQVMNENTAYEMWEKLKALYDKKDLPSKLYVIQGEYSKYSRDSEYFENKLLSFF